MKFAKISTPKNHRNHQISQNITAYAFLACLILLPTTTANAQYAGGNGDPNTPFLIETPPQLNSIGLHPEHWGKHFKLIADINIAGYTGTSFNIIGNQVNHFTGVFDGNGHTINNFRYSTTNGQYIGIFGRTGDTPTRIQNLRLENIDIDAGSGQMVGGLVGYNNAEIINCYVSGTVKTTKNGLISATNIGGLIGKNHSGSITNCSVDGHVYGDLNVGGLAGINMKGLISDCHTNVNVNGTGDFIGGLFGSNLGKISRCYSQGTVNGNFFVGGLTGYNGPQVWFDLLPEPIILICESYATGNVNGTQNVGGLTGVNYGHILNCYARGSVIATGSTVGGLVGYHHKGNVSDSYSVGLVSSPGSYVGGFIGHKTDGTVSMSYWNIDTSNQSNSEGGIGESDPNFHKAATFIDAGWDFVGDTNGDLDYWRMCVDDLDYPKLSWQFTPGDLLCPDGVGLIDLAHYCAYWLDTPCDDSNNYCHRTDLNHDGRNNLLDYLILAKNYLKN